MDITRQKIDPKPNSKIQLKINKIQLINGLLKLKNKKIPRHLPTKNPKSVNPKKTKKIRLTNKRIILKRL